MQVIVEAVPDSFSPLQQPGGEPDGPKGFWETFFGVDPNKGKVRTRTRVLVALLRPHFSLTDR